jgi:hypothetical protein
VRIHFSCNEQACCQQFGVLFYFFLQEQLDQREEELSSDAQEAQDQAIEYVKDRKVQ